MRLLSTAILALGALLAVSPARAQTLHSLLDAAVRGSGLASSTSIAVLDPLSGESFFEHQAAIARNPASNMKLLTAAAALARLGPDLQLHTALMGRVAGDAVEGLVLRGGGDPSLTQADLIELARDLADHGVRRVQNIVVDATYFAPPFLPPAFDQQPDEVAAFRAPISAIAVDRNAYVLRVLPGDALGEAARVRLDGAGYFALGSTVTTGPSGAPAIVAIQRDQGAQMQLLLRGTIPLGITGVSYRRRIENPVYWAGHLMRDALTAAGIRFTGEISMGATPAEAALLAQHESEPLAELISAMGKQSDNFVAEMVFRLLGASPNAPGTVPQSVLAMREMLREAEVDPADVQIVNGSGLFDGNAVSADAITRVLAWVYRNPGIRDEYLAHLSVGGADGTLRRRLLDLPAPRIVRAKTGTLDDVIALSGYVLGREPGSARVFSVLINGAHGKHGPARALADTVARSVARDLWNQSGVEHL